MFAQTTNFTSNQERVLRAIYEGLNDQYEVSDLASIVRLPSDTDTTALHELMMKQIIDLHNDDSVSLLPKGIEIVNQLIKKWILPEDKNSNEDWELS